MRSEKRAAGEPRRRRSAAPATAKPAPSSRKARWGPQRRLEFIDFRLCWDGRLNRSDLTDFFDISVPQASLDIARYTALAPRNLVYDRSTRGYLVSERFRALYSTSAPEHFLNELLASAQAGQPEASPLGYAPPVAIVPSPGRAVSTTALIAIQRAIRQGAGLRMIYQSLARPEPGPRTITPHSLAHDGFRWHVRAYCHARGEFRDFVISRVLRVEGGAEAGPGRDADADWNAFVNLVLAPHPELNAAHRRAIELDYGMTRGRVQLRCRRALLFYVLRHLRLDADGDAAPEAQQIVLSNRAEIERWRRGNRAGREGGAVSLGRH